jgi:hypothetical protein
LDATALTISVRAAKPVLREVKGCADRQPLETAPHFLSGELSACHG